MPIPSSQNVRGPSEFFGLAGFYPSLLRVEHSKELYAKTLGGAVPKEGPPTKLRFFDRVKGKSTLQKHLWKCLASV